MSFSSPHYVKQQKSSELFPAFFVRLLHICTVWPTAENILLSLVP